VEERLEEVVVVVEAVVLKVSSALFEFVELAWKRA
jgi:hypothetical protein